MSCQKNKILGYETLPLTPPPTFIAHDNGSKLGGITFKLLLFCHSRAIEMRVREYHLAVRPPSPPFREAIPKI